jgi:N-acetylmuramoyl-L-alanine amidase CwlA
MTVTNKFSTVHTTAKSDRTIEYIVIHYTAGVTSKAGTALNTANYFATTTTQVSADFVVDDTAAVQYNGDIKNRYTWHCGGSKYSTKGGSFYGKCTNANSIGIEICSTNSTGKMQSANDSTYSFTSSAVGNALELVKQLMTEYNITADHVIRHYDVTGKPCPGIIGWNTDSGSDSEWVKFKAGLSVSSSSAKYYVQVGAFANKTYAQSFLKSVKAAYTNAFIKLINNMYYVQVGAFASKANAEAYLAEVKKDYPTAFIKVI